VLRHPERRLVRSPRQPVTTCDGCATPAAAGATTDKADGTGDFGPSGNGIVTYTNKIHVASPMTVATPDTTCRDYFPDGNYSNSASSSPCPEIV
jgi:hypothetical protein